jgi:hypothetical protein
VVEVVVRPVKIEAAKCPQIKTLTVNAGRSAEVRLGFAACQAPAIDHSRSAVPKLRQLSHWPDQVVRGPRTLRLPGKDYQTTSIDPVAAGMWTGDGQ